MSTFDGVDDFKGFDILKNRWFRTLKFLLMGPSPVVMEDFKHFCLVTTEL